MEAPTILTELTSLHRVLDFSGRLSFAIVFGLCRRSKQDTDPRSLVLDVAGSILDVPYALAHGLLTIHERDPQDKRNWIDVDISRLKHANKRESEYLCLASPANRTGNYRASMTAYQYQLRADSELASIMEPGRRYTIKLASDDLGVQSWAFQEPSQTIGPSTKPHNMSSNPVGLVTSKSRAGSASFEIVDSLPWPPEVRTTMSRYVPKSSADIAGSEEGPDEHSTIEISATNLGTKLVSVRIRGSQHFLYPWVSFNPDVVANDHHMRILNPDASKALNMSLKVVGSADFRVIKDVYSRHNIGPLHISKPDHRPHLSDLVVLSPDVPVTRKIDIRPLVRGLEDGEYAIDMHPKGCWWTMGELAEGEADDGKIPQ